MFKIRPMVIGIATLAIASVVAPVSAQDSAPAPDPLAFLAHVRNARLLAANDLAARNLADCSMPPENAAAAVGTVIDAPPTKIFDQLYYLGTNSVASWAIVTNAGIIQIDTLDNPEEAQRIII